MDLPMPGSPPISVTEPSTMPPPSVRSSSLMPVTKRDSSSPPSPLSGKIAAAAPPRSFGLACCSRRLSHSPHCGQRPSHLRLSWPQLAQRKTSCGLAGAMRFIRDAASCDSSDKERLYFLWCLLLLEPMEQYDAFQGKAHSSIC